MKTASGSSGRYFGSIFGLEEINRFKLDISILDGTAYQPILNLTLAPCAFSNFCDVVEQFYSYNKEKKNEHESGFVSLQLLGNTGMAVVNFAAVINDSVSVNYSAVNREIAKLILDLAKNLVDQTPSFESDCPQ